MRELVHKAPGERLFDVTDELAKEAPRPRPAGRLDSPAVGEASREPPGQGPDTGGSQLPGGMRPGFVPAPEPGGGGTGHSLPPAIIGSAGSAPGWDVAGCLWRRKWLIAVVSLLAMAVLSTLITLMPRSYQAQSTVIFQADRASAARGDDSLREPGFAPDTLANEIETLLSDELLATVVTRLDLVHTSDFASATASPLAPAATLAALLPGSARVFAERTFARLGIAGSPPAMDGGSDRIQAETVAALRGRLTVGPVGLSRVLRITAQAHDPALAAQLANAVTGAYIDAQAKAKETATANAHRWIDQRLDSLRERATRSALAFEEFRHSSGLVRGKDSTLIQEQLTQISTELTRVRQARTAAELMLSQADGITGADLDQLNPATGSALLPKLREQLAEASARLAERQATGGRLLPSVIAARAQVTDLTRSIAIERDRTRQTLRKQVAVSSATEQRLVATLAELRSQIETSETSGARADALERDANADRDTYVNFLTRSRQTDPDLNYESPGTRVVSSASVPLHPVAPNKRVLFPAALVVSLGLGTLAAFVRDGARRGIQTLSDLPGGSQARLGMLPRVPAGDRRMARVFDEAAAQILARVMLPRDGLSPASIVVTSALPQEGKTRAAIALAKVAKDRGLRVLLVDADLRSRGLSASAGLLNCDRNLVRLLRDEIGADEADVYNGLWGLSMLPAGSAGGSPMHLLATGSWEVALRELEGNFDLVIVDTPPILLAGDAWLVARPADATILVTRWASTPLSAVELALEQLRTVKAQVVGVVLSMVSHREHASYGYDDSVVYSRKVLRYHDGLDAGS